MQFIPWGYSSYTPNRCLTLHRAQVSRSMDYNFEKPVFFEVETGQEVVTFGACEVGAVTICKVKVCNRGDINVLIIFEVRSVNFWWQRLNSHSSTGE